MKTKRVWMAVGLALFFVALTAIILILWQKNSDQGDDPAASDPLVFAGSEGSNLMKQELTSTDWVGLTVAMPGFEGPARDKLGGDVTLRLKKNKTGMLEIGEEATRISWKVKKNKLIIRGRGIQAEASLRLDERTMKLDAFSLYEIKRYPVTFYSKAYLDSLPERSAAWDEKQKKELAAWIEALDVDVSTCTTAFTEFLKHHRFETFEPVGITEDEQAALLETYFTPILSLGLQHTSWTSHRSLDPDKLLDGYEHFVLSHPVASQQTDQDAGAVIQVPYQTVADYISPRLQVFSGPYVNELEALLQKSRRYRQNDHAFELKLTEGPNDFEGSILLEAWQRDLFNGLTVIHMRYEIESELGGHAWFIMKKNPYADCQTYMGGSFVSFDS